MDSIRRDQLRRGARREFSGRSLWARQYLGHKLATNILFFFCEEEV
jgi:hypothetical protein